MRTPEERLLRRLLREAGEHRVTPPSHAYGSPHDFVLRHGERFEINRIARMPPGLCYMSAINVAGTYGWTYVEGYALPPTGTFWSTNWETGQPEHFIFPGGDEAIQHAWVVDDHGVPIELTWPKPGRAYLGVRFSIDRAHDCTWHGDATILDDFRRDWPLLRESWPGADSWDQPRDDMLEAMMIVGRTMYHRFEDMGLPDLPTDLRSKERMAWAIARLAEEGVFQQGPA